MKKNELQLYKEAENLRNCLKKITQLSFNISIFDKKYPLENAKTREDILEIKRSYIEYIFELYELNKSMDDYSKDMEVDNED